MPTLEGKSSLLKEPYYDRSDPVHQCFEAATSLGHDTFALHSGGLCDSSATANLTYQKYGESTECLPYGKGSAWSYEVYEIKKGTCLL